MKIASRGWWDEGTNKGHGMELCEATHKALRDEAARVGISVDALMEWIELCGAREQLQRDLEQIDLAMERHRQRHRQTARPPLRLVRSEA